MSYLREMFKTEHIPPLKKTRADQPIFFLNPKTLNEQTGQNQNPNQ